MRIAYKTNGWETYRKSEGSQSITKRKQVQVGLKKSKWSEESSPWGKNPTPGSFCATILSVVGDGRVCWWPSTSSSNSSIELEGASLLKSAKKASVQWRRPQCSCLTEKGWHESLGWSGDPNGLTKPEELGLQAFRKRVFDWECYNMVRTPTSWLPDMSDRPVYFPFNLLNLATPL